MRFTNKWSRCCTCLLEISKFQERFVSRFKQTISDQVWRGLTCHVGYRQLLLKHLLAAADKHGQPKEENSNQETTHNSSSYSSVNTSLEARDSKNHKMKEKRFMNYYLPPSLDHEEVRTV